MHLQNLIEQHPDDFDSTMAQFLVLITHHSLTGCPRALESIVEQIEMLCTYGDLEFFPHQREVMLKMRKLWLLKQANKNYKH